MAPLSMRLRRAWQTRGLLAHALWPLALLYGALVAARRRCYQSGLLRRHQAGIPVVVVGNVIAGGAGKTPVTVALVQHLQRQGWRPGVVSRGYGRTTQDCRAVTPQSDAHAVGDEPLLIARATHVPVWVARRRIEAIHALRAQYPECNVIVCDDGLQHLALARDVEVCVFNDEGTGNGWLLPAGPLREPWPRPAPPAGVCVLTLLPRAPQGLQDWQGLQKPADPQTFTLSRSLASHAVNGHGERVALAALRGVPLHALAAIARPDAFFAMLRAAGLTLTATEALPDHYDFDRNKRLENISQPLICTEKDAVKLWPRQPHAWAVPLQLEIEPGFFAAIDSALSLSS